MKYFIAALVIIALMSGFCAYTLHFENTTLGEVKNLLESARKLYSNENYSAALAKANAAQDIWFGEQNFFAVALVRDDIDELSHAIAKAVDAAAQQSEDASAAFCEALSVIDALLAGEQLTLPNIF